MKFNVFKNKLFLLIFILFIYNDDIFANDIFRYKKNIYFSNQKILSCKNNLKKNMKKNIVYFFKKIKKILKYIQSLLIT